MQQLELFHICPVCIKKQYQLTHNIKIGINFINYNNSYCYGCELRDSLKLFFKIKRNLLARYKERKQKQIKHKRKMKENILYRLKTKTRYRLKNYIKDNLSKEKRYSLSVSKSLGCSWQDFKKHIESKFQKGMSWENHSLYGWHLDHIRPLSSFDLNNPEDFKKACHYTNLQPLWAKDNLKKSDNYEM